MIRTVLAAALLRSTGASVEYDVRRTYSKQVRGKGTSYLTTKSYRAARKKYRSMRAGEGDTLTIQVTATLAKRHGNVEAY